MNPADREYMFTTTTLSNLRWVLKLIRNPEIEADFITDDGYCVADVAHQYLIYRWKKRTPCDNPARTPRS